MLTSEPHFQNSCEVYLKGSPFRRTVYGRTREEVLADLPLLERLLNYGWTEITLGELTADHGDWQDVVVVTPTRSVAMGLSRQWTRAPRGLGEYY